MEQRTYISKCFMRMFTRYSNGDTYIFRYEDFEGVLK